MSGKNLSHTGYKRAQARRDLALARVELREPSAPRRPAAGATSHAVKVTDPEIDRMIVDFERRREK